MAIRSFNSVGGFSVAETPVEVISNVGNVSALNLAVTELSDLGAIGNITITGGTTGQGIITDGSGTLSFGSTGQAANSATNMPYYISSGDTYVVNANLQGLYSEAIEIDGTLEVDGILIEVGTSQNAAPYEVYYDNNGTLTGNTGFSFQPSTGNLSVPGNVNATGNLIPGANVTYDIGSSASRWKDLYLSGTSIFLGTSSITEDASGDIVLTNGDGGTWTFGGTADLNQSTIANGTSNAQVLLNSDFRVGLAGNANVLNVSGAGVVTSTGNVVPLGIKTDNYYYANGDAVTFGGTPGGANTQVQFNDSGSFGATANLTFSDPTGLLTASGNVTGNNFISTSGDVRFGTGAGAGLISVDTGTTTAGVFTTTMTDVNIGLNANVTLCGTGKTLTARGNVSADNITSTTLSVEDFYSSRTAVSVSGSNTTIDTFPASTYRSAKYTIKVSDNTGYQALEVLLVHDSVNSLITVYGSLSTTGADLITLSTVVSGTNILLRATPTNSSTSVNLLGTYVPD